MVEKLPPGQLTQAWNLYRLALPWPVPFLDCSVPTNSLRHAMSNLMLSMAVLNAPSASCAMPGCWREVTWCEKLRPGQAVHACTLRCFVLCCLGFSSARPCLCKQP